MTHDQLKCMTKLKTLGIAVQSSEGYEGENRGIFWIWTEGVTEETADHLDYYGNFWGSDKLNKILGDAGLYFEWNNPAYATIWEI